MFSISGSTIRMTRGDTATINANFTFDGDFAFSSGDMLYFTVRETPFTEIVFQKAVAPADVTQIVIQPADTADCTPGGYIYDLQLSLATGEIYTLLGPLDAFGPTIFDILPEVTYE